MRILEWRSRPEAPISTAFGSADLHQSEPSRSHAQHRKGRAWGPQVYSAVSRLAGLDSLEMHTGPWMKGAGVPLPSDALTAAPAHLTALRNLAALVVPFTAQVRTACPLLAHCCPHPLPELRCASPVARPRRMADRRSA